MLELSNELKCLNFVITILIISAIFEERSNGKKTSCKEIPLLSLPLSLSPPLSLKQQDSDHLQDMKRAFIRT